MTATFEDRTEAFVQGLDRAIDTHMDWTRRILRCTALGESPGNDVMQQNAHTLCQFGKWFDREREFFDYIDADLANRIDRNHLQMHAAIRSLCEDVVSGRKGKVEDLNAFEKSQAELISLLSSAKTIVLTTAARRDPLTNLPMRFGIEGTFDVCRKEADRHDEHLFVVLVDVDHFKEINDNFGHAAGDAALQQIAAMLKTTIRENEFLYRYGGEEFLILLRCSTRDGQIHALQRIQEVVRSTPVNIAGNPALKVTVTQGVAEVGPRESLASAIDRADRALYAGKRAGRDRFVIAQA